MRLYLSQRDYVVFIDVDITFLILPNVHLIIFLKREIIYITYSFSEMDGVGNFTVMKTKKNSRS